MGFKEKLFHSEQLAKKIEFVIIQSSRQSQGKVFYQNINRQQIWLDCDDPVGMFALGEIAQSVGLKGFIENKLAQSKIVCFCIWGKKKLVKRGKRFFRTLFCRNPNKFSQVQRKGNRIVSGNFIIDESIDKEVMSLKDTQNVSDLKSLKNKCITEEKKLFMQKTFLDELYAQEKL